MSETQYNEAKRREAEMLVPVSQLDGVGAKIQERLAEVNISSVQRLAAASVEMLTKIEGIGKKTAENLIEQAKQSAQKMEEEYLQREQETKEAGAEEEPGKEEKLTVGDVFEEDEDYVTEADDVPEATAPDLEGVEDEGPEGSK